MMDERELTNRKEEKDTKKETEKEAETGARIRKEETDGADSDGAERRQGAEPAAHGSGQESRGEHRAEKQRSDRQERQQGKKSGKQYSRGKRRGILKRLLLVFGAVLLLFAAAGYIVIRPQYEKYKNIAYEKLAGMSRADFSLLPDSEIFDKDGNRIGLINAGHYEYAPISEISINIQNAYIAQEDRRFASHHGVDWIATARAGLELIKNKGHITQGGSTITQQVIKNTFLTQERSFPRKITEILMAPELEKKYTKADIMEFYCNTNFYGNRCYGVQAASRFYFNKSAADLTVPEAALLAGLSNSPTRYDPIKHPEAAKEKRNRVLASMLEEGYISDQDYQTYIDAPIVIAQTEQEGTSENYQSSYALHCAALELMKLDGFAFEYTFSTKEAYDSYEARYDEAYADKINLLRSGGYRIYTSLDSGIQQILQESLDSVLAGFTELQDNGKYALQGAGVIVDNMTNYVVAVVGGRGTEDNLNRAYYSARQPGSCIKPILDYAPALDTGEYYPARMVNDEKWEGGPKNASEVYRGPVTVRTALNLSINTVAWKILEDIGTSYGLDYLGKMQFQKLSYIDSSAPAISLGGFTNGVRVVDMAKAYSTLANGGVYDDRTCIVRIEHEQLGNLTEGMRENKTQVYREDTAWMMTDMMKGDFTEGTASGLQPAGGMPAAGKTGTTNDSKNTWFCGYTRYYSGAVYVGYDTPRAMPGVYGATYAGKIWKGAMDRLHEGKALLDWEKPDSVEQRTEENGVTDWRSTEDEERAAVSLHEKEQSALLEEVQGLLVHYEKHAISSMEDTRSVEIEYKELMEKASLLDDGETRNRIMERIAARKAENDKTLAEMPDAIALWEEQEARKEAEEKKIRESEAEEERKQAAEDVNRQEVQDAIDALNAMEYRPQDLADIVNEAIDKLSLISGYPDEDDYVEELNDAIAAVKTLPSESEWKAAEAARESSEQAESAAAQSRTAANQSMLRRSYGSGVQNGGAAAVMPGGNTGGTAAVTPTPQETTAGYVTIGPTN